MAPVRFTILICSFSHGLYYILNFLVLLTVSFFIIVDRKEDSPSSQCLTQGMYSKNHTLDDRPEEFCPMF